MCEATEQPLLRQRGSSKERTHTTNPSIGRTTATREIFSEFVTEKPEQPFAASHEPPEFVPGQALPQTASGVAAFHTVENVVASPNIPIASVRHHVPWSALAIFLVLVLAVFNSCINVIHWYSMDEIVPLAQNVTVHAVLKNCGVSFLKTSSPSSFVEVKSWLNYMELPRQRPFARLAEIRRSSCERVLLPVSLLSGMPFRETSQRVAKSYQSGSFVVTFASSLAEVFSM